MPGTRGGQIFCPPFFLACLFLESYFGSSWRRKKHDTNKMSCADSAGACADETPGFTLGRTKGKVRSRPFARLRWDGELPSNFKPDFELTITSRERSIPTMEPAAPIEGKSIY